MGMTHDPDETAVLDLNIAIRRAAERLAADGDYCDTDRAIVTMLTEPATHLGTSYRRRRAFDAWMRNGDNEYTRRLARGANITFVEAGQITGGIATMVLPDTKERRRGGHHDDAA